MEPGSADVSVRLFGRSGPFFPAARTIENFASRRPGRRPKINSSDRHGLWQPPSWQRGRVHSRGPIFLAPRVRRTFSHFLRRKLRDHPSFVFFYSRAITEQFDYEKNWFYSSGRKKLPSWICNGVDGELEDFLCENRKDFRQIEFRGVKVENSPFKMSPGRMFSDFFPRSYSGPSHSLNFEGTFYTHTRDKSSIFSERQRRLWKKVSSGFRKYRIHPLKWARVECSQIFSTKLQWSKPTLTFRTNILHPYERQILDFFGETAKAFKKIEFRDTKVPEITLENECRQNVLRFFSTKIQWSKLSHKFSIFREDREGFKKNWVQDLENIEFTLWNKRRQNIRRFFSTKLQWSIA